MSATATNVRRVGGIPGLAIETGTIAFAGNYVAGGEVLALTKPAGVTRAPVAVLVFGIAGFIYQYVPATGKLMIRTGAAAQAALTELTAAAYPAGVTGDVVTYIAFWTPRAS